MLYMSNFFVRNLSTHHLENDLFFLPLEKHIIYKWTEGRRDYYVPIFTLQILSLQKLTAQLCLMLG